MLRAVLAAGVLVLAAGCGSHPSPAASDGPTPIAFDDDATVACQQAAAGAWSTARIAAKTSSVEELQDVALREERTGATGLVKAWCVKNYQRR